MQLHTILIHYIRPWKKKTMISKIDLKKLMIQLVGFLIKVMYFMGVDPNWISWIKACLASSKASVLVNGNPTVEFHLERDLRQTDPLYPFLFLLIMEALNVAMSDAITLELFKPIKIGDNQISISHLIYADDAIFIGVWTRQNVKNLVLILKCFYEVSGLSGKC